MGRTYELVAVGLTPLFASIVRLILMDGQSGILGTVGV